MFYDILRKVFAAVEIRQVIKGAEDLESLEQPDGSVSAATALAIKPT